MEIATRRRFLKSGLAAAMTQLLPQGTEASAGTTNAGEFLNGGFKGFALDSIRTRAQDNAFFEAFASTGANIGRIGFPFRKCANCEQYGRAQGDIEALKHVLDWAAIRGIRLVVTGDFSDVEKPMFWKSPGLMNSVVENWRWFASEFKNHPAFAGLDLLNEPNPPWQTGKVFEGHAIWQPLAERAIAAIRSEGVNVPIIYEGLGGGQAIGLRDLVPFKDPQVVYSIHVYVPHTITHQQVSPDWQRTIPYPAGPEWQLNDAVIGPGGWDRQRMELALQDVIKFQKRYNLPIFVGEFSCVRWAPKGSALRYVSDCLSIFKQYGWSWCYHDFRGWTGWDSEIDSEQKDATSRSMDAPVMSKLRSEMASVRH